MDVRTIYFSPTGTTRKIVAAVAAGLDRPVTSFDLTLATEPLSEVFTEEIVIIGIPVYAGRVPELCLERMAGVSANGTPAILVALYGNREYEDALVELRDFAIGAGFRVVAAGAFIGEHSYSTEQQPLAAGRPDADDLQRATEFGRQVAARLATGGNTRMPEISGNVPYRDRVPLGGIAPTTKVELCTLCGDCERSCPTFVIEVGEEVKTRAENCVMCCACVRACPTGAREMVHPVIQQRREMLAEVCRVRKEPVLFL